MTADPSDPQRRFDFSRAEQLGILRDANLPPGKGRDGIGVTPVVLKAVLRAIDDHGRGRACWASQETLASEVGCSIRQLRRAIEALRDLGVLIVERRLVRATTSVSANHYTLVWSQLALLAQPKRDQTNRPSQQTNRPLKAVSRSALKRKEPPPPPPSKNATVDGDAWAAAAEILGEVGIQFVAKMLKHARAAGLEPAEVIEIAETYDLNRAKFSGPGAIACRIREGAWPSDGVVSAAEAKRRAKEAKPSPLQEINEMKPDIEGYRGSVQAALKGILRARASTKAARVDG
ncbi:MAG TPA: helix-turn-helix domain-containing protein [Thermoguttaceae bacterium]|nr:helix-turn-helix domain-containing protein [Thermoguttaceae bacterium]